MKRHWLSLVSVIFIGLTAWLLYLRYSGKSRDMHVDLNQSVVERTYSNYGNDAVKASEKYKIPASYLLALIALESSGRKTVPHRFESHVYNRLKAVQEGKQARMEDVTTAMLKGIPEGGIKNLASSWGPYQLMGYKCFEINVRVTDIRGPEAVHHGARWIRKSYGNLLDSRRFKDAFHMHNTGRVYPRIGGPKTYHKDYVPKGISYMQEFDSLINSGGGINSLSVD